MTRQPRGDTGVNVLFLQLKKATKRRSMRRSAVAFWQEVIHLLDFKVKNVKRHGKENVCSGKFRAVCIETFKLPYWHGNHQLCELDGIKNGCA